MNRTERAVIVWKPQPRQLEFMRRPEPEALYGGAAGGGKSDALLIEALRQVHIPHYRALILRKTYPQLSDLVDKSQMYYRRAFPEAQYNATSHVWVFPSGAKIWFGSMQYTKDRTNYQGKAYDFIGFDELTHFEWDEYSYMMSRNRPTGPGTRVYMRATTNPGGIGHGWVKARFITPAPPGTPIVETVTVRLPDGTDQQMERARVFIPSSVFDNPALLANDPGYLASLASLPEAEKQALLYGSWDSFSGQVFTEWRNDPAHYQDQRWTHVIAPFAIPKHWPIWRGYDFGFSKPFSVGWYAVDEEGRLYRIKELYGCTGRPNEGLRIDPVEQAKRIREAEQNDPLLRGRVIHGVADPAIFDESRGESIAAMMERSPHFLRWQPGDHTRLAGKMQFHYRLRFAPDGRPMLQVQALYPHPAEPCVRREQCGGYRHPAGGPHLRRVPLCADGASHQPARGFCRAAKAGRPAGAAPAGAVLPHLKKQDRKERLWKIQEQKLCPSARQRRRLRCRRCSAIRRARRRWTSA